MSLLSALQVSLGLEHSQRRHRACAWVALGMEAKAGAAVPGFGYLTSDVGASRAGIPSLEPCPLHRIESHVCLKLLHFQ